MVIATVARRCVMVYPNKVVERELTRRVKERGKLLGYSDALAIEGTDLWVTFSPGHDPYVLAKFWRVADGDLVPVSSGDVAKALFELLEVAG